MINKNALGYLRLAMLRNEKLSDMHFTGSEEDSLALCEKNTELIRIEKGLVHGLEGIKEKGRSSLYSEIVEARKNAIIDIYKLTHMGEPASCYMSALSDSTKIKEAADYLEVLLQLHYPKEFPNDLASEILNRIKIEEGVTHRENFGLQPSTTTRQEALDSIKDVIHAESSTEVVDSMSSTTEILDKVEELDSPINLEEGSERDISSFPYVGYRPKVISLYKHYQQQQQLAGTDTISQQESQLENPDILQENGLGQTINPQLDEGPVQ